MIDTLAGTLSKWRVVGLLAAMTLFMVGCDAHQDADTAQQLKVASAGAGAGAKSDEQAPGTDLAVEDSSLTTTVRSAIFADKKLQSQHIKVETEDAAVTLTGTVDSESLRERAVEIASSVDGVAQVQDHLRVRN